MYAGGLSYFSSGRFRCGLKVGASWAEAVESAMSENRQINGPSETVERLISVGVVRTLNYESEYESRISNRLAGAVPNRERLPCREFYLRIFDNKAETRILAGEVEL